MEQADGQMSEAELAAFADGSLPPSRRAEVAARIGRSPELRALVAEQQAVLHAFRALDAAATAVLLVVVPPPPGRRNEPTVLEVVAWNGSMDIARVYGGMLPPLAPGIHRPAP
jgi:anti-sigma factor RsiW